MHLLASWISPALVIRFQIRLFLTLLSLCTTPGRGANRKTGFETAVYICLSLCLICLCLCVAMPGSTCGGLSTGLKVGEGLDYLVRGDESYHGSKVAEHVFQMAWILFICSFVPPLLPRSTAKSSPLSTATKLSSPPTGWTWPGIPGKQHFSYFL